MLALVGLEEFASGDLATLQSLTDQTKSSGPDDVSPL